MVTEAPRSWREHGWFALADVSTRQILVDQRHELYDDSHKRDYKYLLQGRFNQPLKENACKDRKSITDVQIFPEA